MLSRYIDNFEYSSRFRILKGGKISLVVSAFLASTTLSFAAPSGENVVSGNVQIDRTTPNTTNITQSTNKSIINWQNFNVAGNETVNFNMPSSISSSLNRVVGNNKSEIYGKINSNGQVFLVNQNGVYFSKDAQVNTAGFVASTQNITDENFLNSNYIFEGNSDASIINLGTITTDNAYTALLSKKVENEGVIKAHLGSVQLASGERFTLDINGNSLVKLTIDKGTLEGLVANKGAIIADGGEIYLTTSALDTVLSGLVNNTGIIQANQVEEKDGKIILFAHGGTGEFGGSIEAIGGFVETSGDQVQIKDDFKVKTSHWLIDPNDITIDATLAGTISTSLESGDVTVDTTTTGSAGNGDIFVNSDIIKSAGGGATLTLKSERDIVVASGVDITSTSDKLNTVFWSDSDANNDGMIYLKNGSSITTNGGGITLSGGSDITTGYAVGNAQNANGVTLDNVDLISGGGDILIRGKSRAGAATTVSYSVGSFSNVDGVRLHGGNTINSGSGTIKIVGESVGTSGSGNGIELSHSVADLITSNSTSASSIYIEGQGGPSNLNDSWGIYTWRATIQSLSGGGIYLKGDGEKNNGLTVPTNSSILANSGKITLEGTGYGAGAKAVEIAGYVGQKTATDVISSSSDIEIVGDTFATSGWIQSSGNLIIKPKTANTTIGIGGATGTLGLASSYFSTNFIDGFANVIVGDATAGDITIGGTTTYNDHLTFKTKGDVFINASTSLTANGANSLVFWADSDGNNAGGITFNTGSSITTDGGDLWMGGGVQSGTLWNGLSVGSSYAKGTGIATTGGIDINGASIYTSGGDIKMYGYGPTTGGSGIKLKNSIISTQTSSISISASGSIDLRGDGYYTGSGNGHGILVDGSSIIAGSDGVIIEGHASVNNTGQWSAPFFFGTQQSTQAGYVYALNNGTLNFNLYGTDVTNSQSYNNFMQEDYANTTIVKSGENSNITITTYGNSNAGLHLPNIITGGNLTIDISNAPNIGSGATAGWDTGSPWNTIDISAGNNSQLTIGGNTTIIGNSAKSSSVRFTNSSNNFGGTFSATNIKNLQLIDSDTLALNAINTAGTIDIATLVGDLTINGNIVTTSTSNSAIILNAGKNSLAGTIAGGNIIHTNGTISTGTNGRATLYTGSVSNSTGLITLIGSGSGNFRYNSDETATNYTTALSSGNYAVYREQPVLTVAPATASSTYGNSVSITGVTGTITGYLNGDSVSTTTGTAIFSTTATNTSNAGSYNIAYAGGLSNSLGYSIVDKTSETGEYSINKANATVTANSDTKTYNGEVQIVSGFTVNGLVNGETTSVLDGISGDSAIGTNVGIYSTNLSGTDENYNLTFVDGTLEIIAKDEPKPIKSISNIVDALSTLDKPLSPKTFEVEDLPILEVLELSISDNPFLSQIDDVTIPQEQNMKQQEENLVSNEILIEKQQEVISQIQESTKEVVQNEGIQQVEQTQQILNESATTVENKLETTEPNQIEPMTQIVQTTNSQMPNQTETPKNKDESIIQAQFSQNIQTTQNQNNIIQNLSTSQGLKESLQTYEKELADQGFNKNESQTIANAMLKTSFSNPNGAATTVEDMMQAMKIDKESPNSALANGTIENKGSLFNQTLQNLLAKGIDPKEAYTNALEASNRQVPTEISLAKRFTTLSDTQGKLALNLIAKGYSEREAFEIAQKTSFPKESQKSQIVSGEISKEYDYLGSYLGKYPIDEALKLALQTKAQKDKYEKIDANNVELAFSHNVKNGTVPNSLLFEKALVNELRTNSFAVAYQNALQKVGKTKQHKPSPMESLSNGELKKNLTNGEKIWWIEFTKQTLNNKSQKEATLLANSAQKNYEKKMEKVKLAENKLKGKK